MVEQAVWQKIRDLKNEDPDGIGLYIEGGLFAKDLILETQQQRISAVRASIRDVLNEIPTDLQEAALQVIRKLWRERYEEKGLPLNEYRFKIVKAKKD